jgi:hypothetical protein
MPPTTIFTHIQKTAGTSFVKRLVEANIEKTAILSGSIKSIALEIGREHDFVTGHIPYGIHVLIPRRTRYITFLRDPVDRAVSHYHFIRQCDPALCEHDRYSDAMRYTLAEFYKKQRYQNEMARMIAGIHWDQAYEYADSSFFQKWLLNSAMNNLKYKYLCFGLQEQFEVSLDHIKDRLNWTEENPVSERKKKTRRRPPVDGLDSCVIEQIEQSNSLDRKLYRFACKLFKERLDRSSCFGR